MTLRIELQTLEWAEHSQVLRRQLEGVAPDDVCAVEVIEAQFHPFLEARIVRRSQTLVWSEWEANEIEEGLYCYSRRFDCADVSVQSIADSIRQQLAAPIKNAPA